MSGGLIWHWLGEVGNMSRHFGSVFEDEGLLWDVFGFARGRILDGRVFFWRWLKHHAVFVCLPFSSCGFALLMFLQLMFKDVAEFTSLRHRGLHRSWHYGVRGKLE